MIDLTSDSISVGSNWTRVKIKGCGITAYKTGNSIKAWEANVAYTEMTDVYNFGVLILECLTRRRGTEFTREVMFFSKSESI